MKRFSAVAFAVLAAAFASSALAGALYPATVDIHQGNSFKSYSCGLNGYDAEDTNPNASFNDCVLGTTSITSAEADFGAWDVTLNGTGASVHVTGCKQVYLTIVGGVGVHVQYLCPKTP